ncbi:hypothetical protein GCK72_026284 [Caenorhabditis remanei]|uniref:Eukaryotic translation initiation factor 3 subunit C N-terminal domain-containing protein n=1 Tax=Caenorhabditis remanei TaxID=31234 RepID=A0A6A5G520_CAERE|nr:hypothetical protein GCK72_026284 [Caenorhabditis remanei]KAF1749815.1 hypothetical protein GCK72_026284 [Caenorhabditis remanei]
MNYSKISNRSYASEMVLCVKKPVDQASDSDDDSSVWSTKRDTNSSDDDESATKMEQLRRYFLKNEFCKEKNDKKYLSKLLDISDEKNLGLGIHVKISFCIISDLFVLNANISDFMEYETFMNTLATAKKLLVLLIRTDRDKLSVTYSEEDENLKDENEEYRESIGWRISEDRSYFSRGIVTQMNA